MGKGEGSGEGAGEGHGEGGGESAGEATAIAGGTGAIILIVCFCVFGIPMIIAGAVLIVISQSGSGLYIGGVVCIAIAVLMLVGGIVCLVLLCVGVIGSSNKTNPGQQTQTQTVAVVGGGQYGQPGYGQPAGPPGYGQPGQSSYPPPSNPAYPPPQYTNPPGNPPPAYKS